MSKQVVIITGASAGVGRAAARAFARRGARLGLVARGLDGLEAARREALSLGGQAIALQADVSDPSQVEAAAARAEQELGPIDVWVNNAMVSVFAPVMDLSADEYRRVTEVSYLGYVYGTQAALRRMKPRNRGIIIQVGSALSYRSIPLQSAYCAAKHAINGFTESLRTELLHERSRVRVTVVQMPALNTPQFDWSLSRLPHQPQPVPPIYEPEVAARAIVYASRRARREVWVGLPTVLGILGQRFIPGLLDRYLARTGYKSQQTPQVLPPGRVCNLWAPVAGDHGARGRFTERAHRYSPALWIVRHRALLSWLAGGLGVAALMRLRAR